MNSEKQALIDRIDYLEENRRFFQNALETVLDLGDLQESVKKEDAQAHLLKNAITRIGNIIPFTAGAIYTIDSDTWEFIPAFCSPPTDEPLIHDDVEFMIDQGFFAWAIRERRGVFTTSKDQSRRYVLHIITTYSEIMGMFIGLMPEKDTSLPDTSLSLLSVILLNVANALESIEYRKFLNNQNTILETKVEARTRELMLSQQQLRESMEKAKQLAVEAEAANKAKGFFLSNMSHEIRTPINAIIGILELLESSVLNKHQRALFRTVTTEADALLGIINNILDFSKLETHHIDLEEIPFDLSETLEDVANSMVIKAEQKGLGLLLFLSPHAPDMVVGDLTKLRQVLINLVSNAVKFTHTGEVGIWVKPIEEKTTCVTYRFEITDTGIGIPSEKHATIFERFTQADESTTRKYGGTGLGTAICKQIIELMGGRIGLESQPGNGSKFWFEVGFKRQNTQKQEMGKEHSALKDLEVLVVDDSPSQLKVLTHYLEYWGCRISTAKSKTEASKILVEKAHKQTPVKRIIIDRYPADTYGLNIADHLRKTDLAAKIPILLLTSLNNPEESNLCEKRTLVTAVNKPVTRNDLLCALLPFEHQRCKHTACINNTKTVTKVMRSNIRILLVEDYPTNQQIAMAHLTGAGYRVDLAENGQEAVHAFKQSLYDVVMMDIQMPVMDGYEATRQIRALESGRNNHIPIIAMTAHAVKGYREKCLNAGMDDYITKPLKRHLFLSMVEKWIPHKKKKGREDMLPSDVPTTGSQPSTPIEDTTPPQKKAAGKAIKLHEALEEFQGDKALLQTVLDGFRNNVQMQISTIQNALANGDADLVRREAHSIKGGAANLIALPLSKAAAELEKMDKADILGDGAAMLDKLVDEFQRFENEIRDF